MDKVNIGELFKVVLEPDNSKSVLLGLQAKYKIDTLYFLSLCKEGIPLPIPEAEIDYWLYQFRIFKVSEGDESELMGGSAKRNLNGNYIDDSFDDYFYDSFLEGQPVIKDQRLNIASDLSFMRNHNNSAHLVPIFLCLPFVYTSSDKMNPFENHVR